MVEMRLEEQPMSSELSSSELSTDFHALMDRAEGMIVSQLPQGECPVSHGFIPGFYVRTIFMPAGMLITSAIHRTEHPFFIPTGIVIVADEHGSQTLQGPCFGVTTPGTRRILNTIADTVWTTYHRTDKTDVDEIIADILEPHHNPALPKDYVPCHSR